MYDWLQSSLLFDYLKLAGPAAGTDPIIEKGNRMLKLVTIARSPSTLKLFKLNLTQLEDKADTVDAYYKLQALEQIKLSHLRRRDSEARLNAI